MFLVLLTVFVIALIIICAGWLLSPRSAVSKQHASPMHTYRATDRVPPRRAPSGRIIHEAASDSLARSVTVMPGRRTSEPLDDIAYRPRRRNVSGQLANTSSTLTRQVRLRRPVVDADELRPTMRNVLASPTQIFDWRSLVKKYLPAQLNSPWVGLVFILCALFGIGLITLQTAFPRVAILEPYWNNASAAAPTTIANISHSTTDTHLTLSLNQLLSKTSTASSDIARIDQLSSSQYTSTDEFNTWSESTCSAAAMTAVINSYGHNYRLTDILKVETSVHEITPELGLLSPQGIDVTVEKFNFKTIYLSHPTVDDLVNIGNKGRPVIVSFPPSLWPGGHILVVHGGTSDSVYLTDSSSLNMSVMSRTNFLKYWGGFAVVAYPNNL